MVVDVVAERSFPDPPAAVFARAAVDADVMVATFTGYAGLIPGIRSMKVRGDGVLRAGALRDVELSDGTHIVERITAFEAPSVHAYDMAEMNPLQRFLCTNMRSTWTFEPDGPGTKITWTYAIDARPGRGWLAWVVARLFVRAMNRCLQAMAERTS